MPEVKPKAEPIPTPPIGHPTTQRLLLIPTETLVKFGSGLILGAVIATASYTFSIAPERSIKVGKIVPNAQGLATIDPNTYQKMPLGRVLAEQGVLQINTWQLLNAVAQECFAQKQAMAAPEQPVLPETP